jgi:hypothetical protein
LFHFLIRTSERHNDDQIHISLTRAKEIHSDLMRFKKARPATMMQPYSATDNHLDKMFNIN